jgi:hypothetical protein
MVIVETASIALAQVDLVAFKLEIETTQLTLAAMRYYSTATLAWQILARFLH